MKKLIITAHPSKEGFTHQIALAFENESKKMGYETKILDLYQEKQEFLSFNTEKDLYQKPQTDLINWADEFVFVFPIWWYSAPAVVKNFFDANFVAGLAYKYEHGIPKGLFKNKTVRFLTTSGGPPLFYYLRLAPTIGLWKSRFRFCGIKTKSFSVFGPKSKRTPEIIEKQLKKVRKIARK